MLATAAQPTTTLVGANQTPAAVLAQLCGDALKPPIQRVEQVNPDGATRIRHQPCLRFRDREFSMQEGTSLIDLAIAAGLRLPG